MKIVAIHESHIASEHRNNEMDSNVAAEIDRSMRIGFLSGALVILVAFGIIFIETINGWNRLNISAPTVPGDYQPGQFRAEKVA